MNTQKRDPGVPQPAQVEAHDMLLDLAERLDQDPGDRLSTNLARVLRAAALAYALGSLEALMAATGALGKTLQRHGAGGGDPN